LREGEAAFYFKSVRYLICYDSLFVETMDKWPKSTLIEAKDLSF